MKKTKKNKGVLKWVLIGAGMFVLVLVSVVAVTGFSMLGKIERLPSADEMVFENLDDIVIEAELGEFVSGADVFAQEDMEALDAQLNESGVEESALKSDKGITNILLLGIDARKVKSTKSRSDVIILLSVNDNTKKITMTSIMRDTYVNIPGKRSNDKINAASVYGGPALTVKTVENTFGVKIDYYALVNFYAFIDVVDALGGVTVDISKKEMNTMNNYVREINRKNGLSPENGMLKQTGENVKLTGLQAMGYVRDRYSYNSTSEESGDYARTARQREVMTQLINKAVEADYSTLIDIVNSVAENMATDMSNMEILSLAAGAGHYADYEIEQCRLPVNGTFIGGMYNGAWVIRITDMDKNLDTLNQMIFGEQNQSEG